VLLLLFIIVIFVIVGVIFGAGVITTGIFFHHCSCGLIT